MPTFFQTVKSKISNYLSQGQLGNTIRIKSDLTTEIGRSGSKIYSVYSQVDYNTEFNSNKQVLIYEQMLKGDATVHATYDALRLPIISTGWHVDPPEDDPDDTKEMAKETTRAFNGMNLSFEEFLN